MLALGCLLKTELFTLFKPLLIIPVLVAVLTACASLPMQEMSDARQAVEAARESGAAQYASELYTEAQNLLKLAEKLQQQARYSASAQAADQARERAIEARRASLEAQQTSP